MPTHLIKNRSGFTRRDMLRGMAGLGVLALTGCTAKSGPELLATDPEIKQIVDGVIGVDMHTHAAGALAAPVPTIDLARRMREGRFTALCLCHCGDSPVIRLAPDGRIVTVRQPHPGELWQWTQRRLAWFDGLVNSQGIRRMLKPGDLEAAHAAQMPAIVQNVEGCQFLEGRIERIDEVYKRGVRHLQLVHYFRSEMGDNQTSLADQGGLTPFGRDAIVEMNRLGIVVDVAHGTEQFVEAAAKTSKTPLILSHTAVGRGVLNPFTRQITPDHGKRVAETGGVVGVWAAPYMYRSYADYASGIAYAVDEIGVDHVGLGTDNSGFANPAVWTNYADFPAIVYALRRKGFNAEEIGKLVGGNYVRVFNQSVHAA